MGSDLDVFCAGGPVWVTRPRSGFDGDAGAGFGVGFFGSVMLASYAFLTRLAVKFTPVAIVPATNV